MPSGKPPSPCSDTSEQGEVPLFGYIQIGDFPLSSITTKGEGGSNDQINTEGPYLSGIRPTLGSNGRTEGRAALDPPG